MGPFNTLAGYRRRFNELAHAVGEGREVSRAALQEVQVLRQELTAVRAGQKALQAQMHDMTGRVGALQVAGVERADVEATFRADVITGLRRIHAEEAWHRRALRELRATSAYEQAYTDPDPLVSVLIPTYNRLDLLRSRAIPSVLAQEHRNLEIVVVGDAADFGEADLMAGFERSPIRFFNLANRGPYPEDVRRRWLVAGTPPFNEAMARARGAWMAPLADDDSMRPHHLSSLLSAVRERRLEVAYGLLEMHRDGHADSVLGSFPPQEGRFGLQAALLHGHLRLFELELSDADFSVPNDWGVMERMLRAGVRVGRIDEIVADYYPGMLGLAAE